MVVAIAADGCGGRWLQRLPRRHVYGLAAAAATAVLVVAAAVAL